MHSLSLFATSLRKSSRSSSSSTLSTVSFSSTEDIHERLPSSSLSSSRSQSSTNLSALFRRMHPRACLNCAGPTDNDCNETKSFNNAFDELEEVVPGIITELSLGRSEDETKIAYRERREVALRRLHELTGFEFRHNRVPLICTSRWDIIKLLSHSLAYNTSASSSPSTEEDETRRISCLTLNNLSIPFENKAVMALGPSSVLLLTSLVHVIRMRLPECYLCCICLMNLSFLDDAVPLILYYVPSQSLLSPSQLHRNTQTTAIIEQRGKNEVNRLSDFVIEEWQSFNSALGGRSFSRSRSRSRSRGRSHSQRSSNNNGSSSCAIITMKGPTISSQCNSRSPLDDSNSLLRTLEAMLQTYRPFLMSRVTSVEGEAIHWTVGLLRNLTKTEEHCALISKTNIPALVVSFLRTSPHPIIEWVKDSLEEMSLLVLCNLVRWDTSREVVRRCQVLEAVNPVIGKGGIHDFRATMIRASLES